MEFVGFLTDITSHLNDPNFKLQRKKHNLYIDLSSSTFPEKN